MGTKVLDASGCKRSIRDALCIVCCLFKKQCADGIKNPCSAASLTHQFMLVITASLEIQFVPSFWHHSESCVTLLGLGVFDETDSKGLHMAGITTYAIVVSIKWSDFDSCPAVDSKYFNNLLYFTWILGPAKLDVKEKQSDERSYIRSWWRPHPFRATKDVMATEPGYIIGESIIKLYKPKMKNENENEKRGGYTSSSSARTSMRWAVIAATIPIKWS